jgi:Cysteine-rich CPCC
MTAPLKSNVRAHLMEDLFPCPSCGFHMFSGAPGTYEICALCGWEDDPVQLKRPNMGGGANKESLAAHQQRALQRFPLGLARSGDHVRSANWRPLRSSDLQSSDQPTDGRSYFEAAAEDTPHYYWLRYAAL